MSKRRKAVMGQSKDALTALQPKWLFLQGSAEGRLSQGIAWDA